MKTKKGITIVSAGALLVVIASFLAFNYMYKPHRNIAEERASSSLSSTELHENFTNSVSSSESLVDKTVEVSGSITEIEEQTTIILDNRVQVDFNLNGEAQIPFKRGSKITIKGRCVGFDDLLEIVKIDQAILVKKH
ncbi:OB-fold protein [Flagellimonas sp.]|uniref:OB-fold protein n=1 Tax=Flagellimonas sp. TaxID=2058762 RepID=UPI003F4A13B6